MKRFIACALVVAGTTAVDGTRQTVRSGDNVILITLDGVRTEEIFGGLDLEILRSTLKAGAPQRVEDSPSYRRFWAHDREERRKKLMPFLWSLVTEHGSIAGDAASGSSVRLRNRHWFSYPGYSEILLGQPYDEVIKSNDPIRNPYVTVLETIQRELKLSRNKVATFAAWGVFNEIAEHTQNATVVNAGVEALDLRGADVESLNQLQRETSTPWDNTRFDSFTFRLAMKYLEAERPRVLYLAFDETDDWAHDGKYDRALEALSRTDGFLKELWTWLEAQPDYRGRTHMLITTDHGRGTSASDWRSHGEKILGAEHVWIALVSPTMKQRGPWRDHQPLSTSQIAATLAAWMGIDWNASHPAAGRPIR